MRPRGLLFIIVACLSASSARADVFDRVLLPVALTAETPGAFGSRWVTQLTARNDNDETVIITPSPGGCAITVCPTREVSPRTTVTPEFEPAFPDPGAFVFVSHAGSSRVAFNLRVQDISREALTWGTEIPVVRESDVHTDGLTLLDIPTDQRFRATLRVYDFDGAVDNLVLVHFFDLNGNVVLAEVPLRLSSPSGVADTLVPGFAQVLSLSDTFPELAGRRLRIEITPLTQGVRYWAFVSVTNNETQHVTTVTPQ